MCYRSLWLKQPLGLTFLSVFALSQAVNFSIDPKPLLLQRTHTQSQAHISIHPAKLSSRHVHLLHAWWVNPIILNSSPVCKKAPSDHVPSHLISRCWIIPSQIAISTRYNKHTKLAQHPHSRPQDKWPNWQRKDKSKLSVKSEIRFRQSLSFIIYVSYFLAGKTWLVYMEV